MSDKAEKLEALIAAARHWSVCKDVYDDCTADDLPDPLTEYRQSIKGLGEALKAYDAAPETWKRVASFWVPGEPVGQSRADGRVIPRKAMASKFKPILSWGDFCKQVHRLTTVQIYARNPKLKDGSKPVEAWKQLIHCYQAGHGPQAPYDCPVRVDTVFYFPRPQYLQKPSSPAGPMLHTAKPDKDNAEKIVLDVMEKAGWWKNDSRVSTGTPSKFYVAKGNNPGAMITVYVLNDEQGGLFEKGEAA